VELLLRIVCAGQTISIKEFWPFVPHFGCWGSVLLSETPVAGVSAGISTTSLPALQPQGGHHFLRCTHNLFLMKSSAPFAIIGRQLLILHAIKTRYGQAMQARNRMLHHTCCNYKLRARRKSVRDVLEKLVAEKKVLCMHFRRLNFVLVCPPVEKIIVAQRSVHHLCVVLESKYKVSSSSTTGPGRLAT
jgi:hypothetical protein